MRFIQTLHERESLLCGVGIPFVGVSLQLGQVVSGGRSLVFENLFHFGEAASSTLDLICDSLSGFDVAYECLTF